MRSRALFGQKPSVAVGRGCFSWARVARSDCLRDETNSGGGTCRNKCPAIYGYGMVRIFYRACEAASSIRAATSFGLET
jgi:hypothetical protein